MTTDLTRQKFRDTNLLERSHIVDDPCTLPKVVRPPYQHAWPVHRCLSRSLRMDSSVSKAQRLGHATVQVS